MSLRPAELLAAMSYMADIVPDGCCYHSWRVALVARQLASTLSPDIERDVFYAGLLQDIAAIGAHKHITSYFTHREQVQDAHIKSHPQRAAAMLDWLPGMGTIAEYVRWHHERWDGQGYPGNKTGEEISLGSQILGMADTADIAGCFGSPSDLAAGLRWLAPLTGNAWSKDLWEALVRSVSDTGFYKQLMDTKSLAEVIAQKIKDLKVPTELDNDEGTERVLHLFAALVDLKDTSTTGHSLRAARYAKSLAEYMKIDDADIGMVYRAGLVHDCGRVGIPTHILNRSGRLNDKELKLVRKHATMTIRVMSCMPDYADIVALGHIAGHDHERYDGGGYPDGLAGEDIPMPSRILGVADAFDAMISATSYRILSPRCAVLRLQQASGKQFDPTVVDAMVEAVDKGAISQEISLAA